MFDIEKYLANRHGDAITQQKQAEIDGAYREKAASLAAKQAEFDAYNKSRNESWAGQLSKAIGLDDRGFIANRVNDLASFTSGASRVLGQVATLPINAVAMAETVGLDEANYQSYNNYVAGKATPEDMDRLTRPKFQDKTNALAHFQAADNKRQLARDINTGLDKSNIVDTTMNRQGLEDTLSKEFKASWGDTKQGVDSIKNGNVVSGTGDLVKGVAGLLYGFGKAGVTNPAGVREYLIENLPQLGIGALGTAGKAGMLASNMGYAADNYQQGLEEYAKKNGGQLPPDAERQKMAMYAASLALAEQASDMVDLGMAKVAANATKKGVKATAKAGVTGVLSEAPTEGYQTYAEGEIKGKSATPEEIYKAASIGGLVGGGLVGGMRGTSEAAQAVVDFANRKPVEKVADVALKEAASSGDVSKLLDKDSEHYAPEKAVQALHTFSRKEDTTPEQQQENLTKAADIVSEMKDGLVKLKEADSLYTKEGLNKSLVEAKTDLDTLTKHDPTDTATLAAQQSIIDGIQSKLDRVETPEFAQAAQAHVDRVKEAESRIQQAESSLGRFSEHVQNQTKDITPDVDSIKEGNTDSAKTADKVIVLSMASPQKLSPEQAQKLADDTTNGLREDQRDYFRQFAADRIAHNKMQFLKGVEKEIIEGKPGFIGANQYRTRIGNAIATGNKKSASINMGMLSSFVADHMAKAREVTNAYNQYLSKGIKSQVRSDGKGGWFVEPGQTLTEEQRLAEGAVFIDARTKGLVESLAVTSPFLQSTLATAAKAVKARFNPTEKTNGTKAPEAKQAETQRQEAPKPAATPVEVTGFHGSPSKLDPVGFRAGEPVYITESQGYADSFNTLNKGETGQFKATLKNPYYVTSEGTIDGIKYSKPVMEKLKASGHDGVIYSAKGKPQQTLVFDGASLTRTDVASQTTNTNASVQSTAKVSTVEKTEDSTNSVVESPEPTTLQESSEKTDEEPTQTEVEGPVEGTLEAVKQKAPEGSSYEKLKFGDLFKQKAGTEEGSQRPLVVVKNFLSALKAGTVDALTFVKDQEELTSEQEGLISLLQRALASWGDQISKNLVPTHNEFFNHEDPIRYLIQDKDVEENVKTAMLVAIFSMVNDQDARVRINGDEAINAILHRQADEYVSSKERKVFGKIGVYQHILADSLGGKIIEALGIAPVKEVVGTNTNALLRMSLGAKALKLMEDVKLIEGTTFTNAQMAEFNPSSVVNDNKGHVFYRMKEDGQGNLVPRAKQIAKAMKGTGSLLDRMFGMEEAPKFAYLVPSKKVDQTTDTGMKVPNFLKKILKQKNQEPWTVNADVFNVFGLLSTEQQETAIGVVNIDSTNTHADDVMGKEAKNEGLRRELGAVHEFFSEEIATSPKGSKTPFYLGFSVWVQQRVGVANTAINPVASKVVRWLIAAPKWETMVKFSEENRLQDFFLKTSEGFGIKPEKGDSQKAIDALEAFVKRDDVAPGLKAIQKNLKGEEVTDSDKQYITNAIEAGEGKLHTLASLVAYARYMNAVEAEEESFTTNIMGEVDGVSNGSILNHMLYGAAQTASDLLNILESGGIYGLNSAFKQYNLWRGTPGNLDIYETAAQDTKNAVVAQVPMYLQPALFATGGDIDRNLMKSGINPINYGSGVASINNKVAGGYLDSIRTKIGKLSKEEATQEQIDAFIGHVNTILKEGKVPQLPVGKPIGFYMGYERPTFTSAQLNALQSVYTENVGRYMTQVIKEKFDTLMRKTKTAIKATSLMFSMYEAVYKQKYNEALNALPKKKNGKPVRSLTVEEDAAIHEQLKYMLPVVHSAMSKAENNWEAGLLMMDNGKSTSTNELFKLETKFGIPLASGINQMTLPSQEDNLAGPGVSFVANTTQSTDSRISHMTQEGRQVFNMHDAIGSGVGDMREMAHDLNANTFKAMMEYSPMMAAYEGMIHMIHGMMAMKQAGTLTDADIQEVTKVLEAQKGAYDGLPDFLFLQNIGKLYKTAAKADRIKYEMLSQLDIVDQYAFDGGSYQVTDADRAQAKKLGEATSMSIPKDHIDLLEDFVGLVFNSPKEGTLGNFFQGNNTRTGKEMVDFLNEKAHLTPINAKMLSLVSKLIPENLTVTLVTPETEVLEQPNEPSDAWFVSKEGQYAIYFNAEGLNHVTAIHEVFHAALSGIIANPTKEIAPLVSELEELLKAARKQANGKYTKQLSNLQEFVAYGMTDATFQINVLKPLQFKSTTKTNTFVDGMKKFISNITQLLFGKNTPELENGLTALISNVSGLAYAAAQERSTENKTGINLSMATDRYTTQEIFEGLDNGSVGGVFKAHLGNLLDGIVNKLYGPFGAFGDAMRKDAAGNPMAVWFKAVNEGKAPFASTVFQSGFAGSAQEDFVMEQVEATVATALSYKEATTHQAYKELTKLFNEAKNKLTVQDFLAAGFKADDYDFVFKAQANNGDFSDYLSRFAAIGLGNEQFNNLLKFNTSTGTQPTVTKSLFERLVAVFQKMLDVLSMKVTRTYAGQQADEKLVTLVGQLVDIQAKRENQLKDKSAFDKLAATAEDSINNLSTSARKGLGKLVTHPSLKNSKYQFVQTASGIAHIVSAGRTDILMDKIRSARDYYHNERDGMAIGFLRELAGPKEMFQKVLMAVKHNENLRQNMINQVASILMKNFGNNGKDFTKQQRKDITAVLLRSGAHNLLGQYTLQQIGNMLTNPVALQNAIAGHEAMLTTNLKDLHIQQANGLGYWKATDRNVSAWLMKNAYVIARMSGTQFEGKITEQEAQREEPTIKTLATLYALKYSTQAQRNSVSEVLNKEAARKDGNGIELTLEAHRELEKDALERLFGNNPMLMIHGYTPEIFDPHVDMQVVDANEGKRLLARGYKEVHEVLADPDVPDTNGNYGTKKKLYVLNGGGLNRRVSGMFSLTSLQSKGTTIHNGYMNINDAKGVINASNQVEVTNTKMAKLAQVGNPSADLSQMKDMHVAPVYNDRGEVVNWAHLMTGKVRDNVLKRENRFDKVMGTLAGSTFDKQTSQESNKKVVTALYQQYQEGYDDEPWAYVEVGPKVADNELREVWQLLTDQTKEEIQRVWESQSMYVRKDSLDITFGYRKISASSVLTKEKADLEGFQKLVRQLFHSFAMSQGRTAEEADDFAKKIGTMILKGERGWQELNGILKDIIVVKNLVTLTGNVWSNASLLWLMGVSDGWKKQWTALRGIMTYEDATRKLREIEMKLEAGYSHADKATLEQEATILRDDIARNPVTRLVNAGLMPSIVEDVDIQDDPYSYKTAILERTNDLASKLPSPVKSAAKFVFMTHDTPLYKVLSRATQYSDFLARYALYEELTTRKENQLSHDQAVMKALQAFVHYDVPMQRGLQYLDDMGSLAYMKYFLRVQKVLMDTLKENPARVLSMAALGNLMEIGPVVLDSSFVAHLGNQPFRAGPAQLPWALDELLTIKAGMALLK